MKLMCCFVTVDEPRDTGGVDIQDYQIQLDAGNGNYHQLNLLYTMFRKTHSRFLLYLRGKCLAWLGIQCSLKCVVIFVVVVDDRLPVWTQNNGA